MGVTFPDDVRAAYRIHDGQAWGHDLLFGRRWNSLADVVGSWREMKRLHVRAALVAAPHADDLSSVRIAPGNANLILGCDIVVATSANALETKSSASNPARPSIPKPLAKRLSIWRRLNGM